MLTVNHFLILFAALALWVLSLYVHPFGKCLRCRGRRMLIHGSKRKRRPKRCWLCKGIGRRQRPGSRTVHRTARKIRREIARQRLAKQHAAIREDPQ